LFNRSTRKGTNLPIVFYPGTAKNRNKDMKNCKKWWGADVFSPVLKILLTMKLIVLLICGLGLLSSMAGKSYAQSARLTFALKDVSIKSVLKHIEYNSEFSFMYDNNEIDANRKVNIEVKDETIEIILNRLFGNETDYRIIDRHIILFPGEKHRPGDSNNYMRKQQIQQKVSGKVTDSSGLPLPGVTVVVKGTTQGTVTNANGEYSITNISEDAALVFSFVGMRTQEVVVGEQASINITMSEETIGIEEVVAVGYGTQKRANLVGAVSDVKIKDFSTRPYSDVTNVLQGVMPGLNIKLSSSGADPTTTQQINVRGFNSINGGEPLVLIDGVESDISNINPNDIESVSVLKDAQSSAIYGARGAFGVILITTKKGTPGEFKIQYSNNFSLSRNTTRTDFITDPYVFGKTVETAINRYNNSSYYIGYTDEDWEILRKVGNGEIEPYYEKKADGTYRFYDQTDFYNLMYRKWRPSQMHNFTVNGGSEKLFSYFSGRIMDIATVQNLPKNSVKRYNLNLQLVFKPYDWIEIGGGSRYSQKSDREFGGGKKGWIDPLNDFWVFHDLYPNYPAEINGIGVDVGRSGKGSQAFLAPQFDGANTWRKWKIYNYTNDLSVKITPVNNFEINFNYSNDYNSTNQMYREAPFEFLSTSRLELETGGQNRYGEWQIKDLHNTLNIYGTYTQSLKEKHNFKLMLGYNQEQFRRDRFGAQVENLPSKEIANLGVGDEMYAIEGSTLDWDIKGNYGRFNYDYDDKYLLEINARLDGSSRFPVDNQWGFFPSIGLGWKVSRENFWSQDNVFSNLKIRTSYGSLGNQDVPVNTFLQLVNFGQSDWLDEGNVTNYARVPNPLPGDIGWETVNSTNIGLDLGFFNNKLMVYLDWYQRITKDMYLPGRPLPAVFGASEPKRNYAALRNRGAELSLTYNNSFKVLGSNLSLRVDANISNFKAVITKFDNPTGLLSTFWEGQILGEIWGYHVDGQFQSDEEAAAYQENFNDNLATNLKQVYSEIFSGSNKDWAKLRAGDIKYVDMNKDGKIDKGENTLDDHGDMSIIGNFMPQFPFGFGVNVGWKRFDFSLVGQGVGKQDWYPRGPVYWAFYHRPYQSFIRKDLLDHVWDPDVADNSRNNFPQIKGYPAYHSEGRSLYIYNDYHLKNIGYLRIKNLTIGYNMPKGMMEKVGLRGLRLFFSGENIFTYTFSGLTKYIDPEIAGNGISFSDPNLATGTNTSDKDPYPQSKTYSFGIVLDL
jgi:TonB-linked SusC/RagA family outer membrane protein